MATKIQNHFSFGQGVGGGTAIWGFFCLEPQKLVYSIFSPFSRNTCNSIATAIMGERVSYIVHLFLLNPEECNQVAINPLAEFS